MKKVRVLAVIVCMMTAMNFASAEIIQGIDIDFVTIGNAGNAGDTQVGYNGETGLGSVDYNYRIGKYEVTNAQWNIFTDAAGAPTGDQSYAYDESAVYTGAQQPTNMVSWYEAAQFCNWLTSDDKGLGAYQLNTDGSVTVNREAAMSTYGIIYVLPTNNEWYKAAYYKPDGSGYSLYAYGTDTAPVAGVQSNYNNAIGVPWNVGTGTQEQNGTFDMMGNVHEWDETKLPYGYSSPTYGIYGGCFASIISPIWDLSSYRQDGTDIDDEYPGLGFRIASIPEPATFLLLGLGGFVLRRKKH